MMNVLVMEKLMIRREVKKKDRVIERIKRKIKEMKKIIQMERRNQKDMKENIENIKEQI